MRGWTVTAREEDDHAPSADPSQHRGPGRTMERRASPHGDLGMARLRPDRVLPRRRIGQRYLTVRDGQRRLAPCAARLRQGRLPQGRARAGARPGPRQVRPPRRRSRRGADVVARLRATSMCALAAPGARRVSGDGRSALVTFRSPATTSRRATTSTPRSPRRRPPSGPTRGAGPAVRRGEREPRGLGVHELRLPSRRVHVPAGHAGDPAGHVRRDRRGRLPVLLGMTAVIAALGLLAAAQPPDPARRHHRSSCC